MTDTQAATPVLEQLRPSDMTIVPLVQRRFDENFAKKIVKNFNAEMIGVMEISRRPDGMLVVMDGQHRRHALIKKGLGNVPTPCLIYDGLSPRDEALRFVARNGANRKPNNIDIFRLRVLAEDPVAVGINNVMVKHGLTVSAGSNPGSVSAVSALEFVYAMGTTPESPGGGSVMLDKVITTLHAAFGRDRNAVDGTMIRAMATLLQRRGRYMEVGSLIEKLGKHGTAGRILGQARSRASITSKSLTLEAVEVMIMAYNFGRSSRRIQSIV